MASDLQQTRYDQLIRRVGGIIGPGSKVSEALSELFPVIDVENVPAELLALSRTALGQGSTLQNPSAGDNNISQLFNPVGSGILITVTSLIFSSNTLQGIEYATTETPLTTGTGNEIPRDTRSGVTGGIVGQIREVQQVGSLSPFGQIVVSPNVSVFLENERGLFVLSPGTGLSVGTTTVNTVMRVNYMWRERVALESELLF